MKATDLLNKLRDAKTYDEYYPLNVELDEAIEEIKELGKTIKTSIEEIEYALAKPEYAEVYLNNAIRFLKEFNGN